MTHAKKGDLVLVEMQHTYWIQWGHEARKSYMSYELASVDKATRDGRAMRVRCLDGTVRAVRDANTTCYLLPALGVPLAALEERIGRALAEAETLEAACAVFRAAFPTPVTPTVSHHSPQQEIPS